jgi:hypothetical protein
VNLAVTWREIGAFVTLAAGASIMLLVAHQHYPVQEWLCFRYLLYWAVGAVWLAACASAGDRLLSSVLGLRLPAAEGAVLGLSCGVLLFFWALFVAGLLGCLNGVVSVMLPVLMLGAGGKRPWQKWRRLTRHAHRVRLSRPELGAALLGTVALAMIYLTVSTPDNIGFDAQWYHLPIAEHFAAAGRIGPFVEGWYLGAYPHLTSVLYAWAFSLPGTQIFDRVLLSAHLEWFLFLTTLFSVPLLLRRLLRAPPRSLWSVVFLFPSVFLYDGGLFAGADHVLAFWVIPVYLALLRVERELSTSRVALLTLLLAGAVLTKYQAMYVLLPVAVRLLWTAFFGAGARSSWAARARRGPVLAVALGLALTAPHWLANVLWYGDPFFPALHSHLHVHPWTVDTDRQLPVFYQAALWQPQGSVWDKAIATARALLTFSFEPHDWPTYHGEVPVFGSLFTVLSLLLPFLRNTRRVGQLILSTLSGVALWFLTSHQDRYLQALLPWMATATAALLVMALRQLPRLRGPMGILLGVQWAWGADVYFIPAKDNSYENDRPSPIKSAVDLAASGYRGDYQQRLHPYAPWEELGRALPASAKVLVHERYLHLGLGRQAVSDLPGWQSGISYAVWRTPQRIGDELRALGVTHVVWETARSHEADSWAGDLAFLRFVQALAGPATAYGSFSVAALQAIPNLDREPAGPARTAWYGCPADNGRYRELAEVEDQPNTILPALEAGTDVPSQVEWLIVDRSCRAQLQVTMGQQLLRRGNYDVFAPRR